MINSFKELKFFLDADRYALNRKHRRPTSLDYIWKFQRALRFLEYTSNHRNFFLRNFCSKYFRYRKNKLGFLLGFDIPENVFGAGLSICHHGFIAINGATKIGRWCQIHQGVVVGTQLTSSGETQTPLIGDNVWIGSGAKIFGKIQICNNVVISANTVVNKNVSVNTTCYGNPLQLLQNGGSSFYNLTISRHRCDRFFDIYPEYIEFYKD